MKSYLLVLLILFSYPSAAVNIEFQTEVFDNNVNDKNILFVYSGYGESNLNYCNSEFFNYLFLLNNYNYFNLYFDIFYLNSQMIPEQYHNFLSSKLQTEKFDKVVLLNLNSSCLLPMAKLANDIYSIGFTNSNLSNTISLKYDFDKLFNFINRLNLPISSDIYYFTSKSSRYDIKNENILFELQKYTKFKIHSIKIKTISELRHKLIELNKNDKRSILIFNMDFLYSDIYVKLIPITDILVEIRNYNRTNIPVNISLLCNVNNNILVLNLSFDSAKIITNLNTLLKNSTSIEITSDLIINLKQMYYLGLDSNLESDEYLHLFDGISKLY